MSSSKQLERSMRLIPQYSSATKWTSMQSQTSTFTIQMDVPLGMSLTWLLEQCASGTICLRGRDLFAFVLPTIQDESSRLHLVPGYRDDSSGKLMSFLKHPIHGSGEILGKLMESVTNTEPIREACTLHVSWLSPTANRRLLAITILMEGLIIWRMSTTLSLDSTLDALLIEARMSSTMAR